MAELDFTGDPPDHWWSEMAEDDLRAELATTLRCDPAQLERVWTEEEEGAAYAATADGRTIEFVGDGQHTVWRELPREQFDLAHGLRVAKRFRGEPTLYLAAVLHDAVEDGALTLRDLLEARVPLAVNELVLALTRKPQESYGDYIMRVARSPDAAQIKVADIQDNLARMDAAHESLRPRYEAALRLFHERYERGLAGPPARPAERLTTDDRSFLANAARLRGQDEALDKALDLLERFPPDALEAALERERAKQPEGGC